MRSGQDGWIEAKIDAERLMQEQKRSHGGANQYFYFLCSEQKYIFYTSKEDTNIYMRQHQLQ